MDQHNSVVSPGPASTRDRFDAARSRSELRDRIDDRRVAAGQRAANTPVLSAREQITQDEIRRGNLIDRLRQSRHQPRLVETARSPVVTDPVVPHRSYVRPSYYDRPDMITHTAHHVHSYYDHHNRLYHRIIWPRYYYPVCYTFGPRIVFQTVYPYYHRKYVFISLGGWWPSHYDCVRYYWYGWHPYGWYGYYPVAQEVGADTYKYYTYNYYLSGDNSYTTGTYSSAENEIQPVDESTWADVRAKLEKQKTEPAPQTLADTRFEEGVKSFEAGDFSAAAEKFAVAMSLAPNDMILPFAYAQALFADRQYAKAAEVLRGGLQTASPEQEGVFYPRGLYPDDDVLFAQVQKLVDGLETYEYDADMQLLLGYHLLGLGETEYAREPLERASKDQENAEAARILLNLLEKIETQAAATKAAGAQNTGASPAKGAPSQTVRTDSAVGSGASPAGIPDASNENTSDGEKEAAAHGTTEGTGILSLPKAGAGETTPPAKREDDNAKPAIQRIDPATQ